MEFFKSSDQRVTVAVNIVVVGVALFVSLRQEYIVKKNSFFDELVIDSFAPVQNGITYVKTTFTSIFDHYLANVDASRENDMLKETLSMLERQLFQHQELERENERLKAFLNFSDTVSGQKVLAQIVAADASSDFRVFRINKGKADGVTIQATVVTFEGLVGYVFRLTDNFSDVITILDSNNRVDATISRIRAHGIVEGQSSNVCKMKYISRTTQVVLGDTVITSGMGNLYPKGIKIGTISKIEKDSSDMTQRVLVTPSVDFDRLEEVIILLAAPDAKLKKIEWNALDYTESIGN